MEEANVIDALYVLLNDTLPTRVPLFRNVQSLIAVCTRKSNFDESDRYHQLMKRSGYYIYQINTRKLSQMPACYPNEAISVRGSCPYG